MHQQGFAHLLLILLVVTIVAVISLFYLGVIKNPAKQIQSIVTGKKEPTVALKTQYQNPFDKATQYVNPFSSYQNPFDNLK